MIWLTISIIVTIALFVSICNSKENSIWSFVCPFALLVSVIVLIILVSNICHSFEVKQIKREYEYISSLQQDSTMNSHEKAVLFEKTFDINMKIIHNQVRPNNLWCNLLFSKELDNLELIK